MLSRSTSMKATFRSMLSSAPRHTFLHAERKTKPLHVCMLGYAFYESDTRILQYATALAERGDTVDVIALRRNDALPAREVMDGVSVFRVQARTVDEKGLIAYGSRLLRFFLRAAWLLHRKHGEQPYDVVHVHNVPDFLVFAALSPRLKGVPVILDIHDLLPEFFASKFGVSHASTVFKGLALIERWSAAFASHVIIANHIWRDRFVARSCRKEKCSVVRNRPDLSIFRAERDQPRTQGRFLLTYPGSLNAHQGLDVAIRAFASVADQMPDAEFHIYGEGAAKSMLVSLVQELGMDERILFHGYLPSREIAQVMARTDLAIEPKRATSAFGNEALSTKILEFMSLGVPIIASKTRVHAFYYDDSILQYYENDDPAQLALQMVRLKADPALRAQLAANAKIYVESHSWDARKHEYTALVDALASSVSPAKMLTPLRTSS